MLHYLKAYAVFNAEQLTDCPEAYLRAPKIDPAVRAAARSALLDAIPAKIELGGGVACYNRARDVICLPAPEAFDTVDDYQATFAHEAVHWSGAPHRLNREFGARFGDEAYAFEELVVRRVGANVGVK